MCPPERLSLHFSSEMGSAPFAGLSKSFVFHLMLSVAFALWHQAVDRDLEGCNKMSPYEVDDVLQLSNNQANQMHQSQPSKLYGL